MASFYNRKTNRSAPPLKRAAPSRARFKTKHEPGKRKRFPGFLLREQRGALAFLATVGNNLFYAAMRLACRLALALVLSSPVWGQAPATAPTPAENPPAAQAPADTTPSPEKKTAVGIEKEKKQPDSATTSGTKKRRKRETPAPEGGPRKIVVREGGASEPSAQIVPGMTAEEAARERQNAQELLSSTDDQLKRLADRPLDARQQETVVQIRNYMNGVREALHEGDVSRARTLAEKAHLLADDLLKH
jgi:hypothetical protein